MSVAEGDRKAYYEMSKHTMNANKQLMSQLREENKELRKALAALQREVNGHSRAVTDEDELHELTRQVHIPCVLNTSISCPTGKQIEERC